MAPRRKKLPPLETPPEPNDDAPDDAPATTEWREVVAEAWRLRQEVERRILLARLELARLERTAERLDREFAGERIPPPEEEEP